MAAAATPAFTSQKPTELTHTISLFVADKPGVLVRVALVFSRRGYNIESLVVSPAGQAGFSRMTITTYCACGPRCRPSMNCGAR